MTRLAKDTTARGTPQFRSAFHSLSCPGRPADNHCWLALLPDAGIAAHPSSFPISTVSAFSDLSARGITDPVAEPGSREPRIVVLYDND